LFSLGFLGIFCLLAFAVGLAFSVWVLWVVWVVVRSEVMLRWLRVLRSYAEGCPVEPELRGWSWQYPPVRPRAFLGLSVYDVAPYCPTRRDVWLRRVSGVRVQPSQAMRLGLEVHEVISSVVGAVRRYLHSPGDAPRVYRVVERLVSSRASTCGSRDCAGLVEGVGWLTYHTLVSEWLWSYSSSYLAPAMLSLSEVRVDGTPLGLSSGLRVDAIPLSNVVVDVKVGRRSENHEIAVAAYAMALEASLEVPVDYGLLVYIGWNGAVSVDVRGVYVGPDLRRAFIDSRDETIDMLLASREPPKATDCPSSCPYLEVCGK